jgi:hypothetical protein
MGKNPDCAIRWQRTQQFNDAPRNYPRDKCGVRRRTSIQQVVNALVAAGHVSLDEQAKALGVHRNTAWTIVKNKHKLARLLAKTTSRILANPETPPTLRAVVLRYLTERGESRSVASFASSERLHRSARKPRANTLTKSCQNISRKLM